MCEAGIIDIKFLIQLYTVDNDFEKRPQMYDKELFAGNAMFLTILRKKLFCVFSCCIICER